MNSNSPGEPKRNRRHLTRTVYFLGGIGLGTAFGLYLWGLYGQLTTAFNHQDQFTPTRIYSDVARIAPKQLRPLIEDRLKSHGYSASIPSSSSSTSNLIQFNLRQMDYPAYLLPFGHPQIDTRDLKVRLTFENNSPKAVLQSIQLGDREIPDLFLEPELIATLSHNGEIRNQIRTYLKFEEIPANIWKAIIAIEDQHFLEHKGLDPRGIARAIWINLKTFSFAQGGSTLTQQLVKNLMARRTKNLFRKANEVFLALLLEATFDKERILERYLNEVYLGQVGNLEVHGVAQGAAHFFGKKLEELNLAEVALMAGLIRGPGFYSPYRYQERAMERQRLVLKKMVETGLIAEGESQVAAQQPIRLAPPQTVAIKAPFFTDYVKAELVRLLKKNLSEQEIISSGFRVYTTLDPQMNLIAQRSVTEGIQTLDARFKLPNNQRLEGALASVDHSTGYIRALVGGRSYIQSNFNRILNMKRQVGSTFKPIVYLTAIQKGEDAQGIAYGPGHPAEDAPWSLTYDRGKQTWTPRNYDKEFRGWVSYRTALAHSINTIAAKLGYEVGIDNIIQTTRTLGVESDLPRVPSLSLGVAELSPIELLKVYATLANRGIQDELTVIRGITQEDGSGYARFVYHPKQVIEPSPTDLITSMLQSVFTEGTAQSARRLGFDRPAAGKTGTTSNHRDAWFAGYTPQLTTVVWVGMDQNSSVVLTGANSALPIWVNFMKQAHQGLPVEDFTKNPDLIEIAVDQHSGKMAESDCPAALVVFDKYIKGHEPRDKACETLWPVSGPQKIEDQTLF